MQPTTANDYKSLLSEVIKKQIVILGPDITLAKARNVPGLVVDNTGTVTSITGEPQTITQSLIDQFVQLSGLIVKKTMEPLLSYHAADGTAPAISNTAQVTGTPAQQPMQPTQPSPSTPSIPSMPSDSAVEAIDTKVQSQLDEITKQMASSTTGNI